MKKLYLNTGGFETIFNNLKESFDGTLEVNNNEYTLSVKSKWAKGTISGVRLEKEMSYLDFNLVFNHDVTLSIESFKMAPVFFIYNDKGTITHSFGANGERKNIKEKQNGILHNTAAINSVLYFESHKQIQFSMIAVPVMAAAEDENFELISQLKKKFTKDSGNYLYVGAENERITEKLVEFKKIPQKGIVKSLLQKSIVNSIVEIEVAQHSYNYIKTFDPIINLAAIPINGIKRLSNINIAEVMNAAGLASRNYLPRIFKEKYQLSYKPYNQKLAS